MTLTSSILAGLNAQQRAAVAAVEGPVLVLAGAGSGKTRVITHRIAHLVLDRGVDSGTILAVTFTNKAAEEMKARAAVLVPGLPLRAWVSTFHSFCVRLLRREAGAVGLDPGFLIYDEDDQLSAVREAMRALDLSEKLHPPRRMLSRISARKNSGRTGDEEDGLGADLTREVMARYQEVLKAAGAVDFDDLLLRAGDLLDRNEAVRGAWRRRFPFVLVDEYQDTNRPQYELVRSLVGPGGNLTVVGDEDQSIYSWRGADISNILDFEHDFPGARVFRLEENYRSSQRILDVAGALVSRNVRRKGKTLRAVKGLGGLVRLHEALDEYHEAAWVTERIVALRSRGPAAVLFRMNAQSRLFEEALLRLRLPYLVVGGVGFYERKEVKDILAYLRLVQNPRDSVAFRRVLNVPPRGLGAKALEEIDRAATLSQQSPWDAARRLGDEAALPARVLSPLRRFVELVETLREEAGVAAPLPDGFRALGLRRLLERVLELSGYGAALAREDSQESQDRLENLAELLSAASDYETREEAPTLAGFLDRAALLSETDRLRDDVPVLLMTLHAAKGLEFESVFVVGLEEGLLPHSRSLSDEDGLEEERRLCYVGMTRAMDELHLSWARSRQVFGQRRPTEASRFLQEIPEDRLERSGGLFRHPPRRAGEPAHREPAAFATVTPEGGRLPADAIRPGVRVRHPLFGVGTVLRRDGDGDELKVTVSFPGVGAKKLVARYAGLEVV
ncbi:MAG TPA: UvrD-helicase domain-containing protein [Vicinamibacteria bacterium]|nr:UvrD-helicase domain-containing protein [Vicinamibacteria bacterium]